MYDKVENITAEINGIKNKEYLQKANEYIERIKYAISRHSSPQLSQPIIVMSKDVYDILTAFTDWIKLERNCTFTCCGCATKLTDGRNILLIAFNIL